MILRPHVHDAEPWRLDGVLGLTLEEAIREAAEQTASDAGSDLLESPSEEHRAIFRDHMVEDMTRALREAPHVYRAPDGVLYSLEEQ